MKQCAKFTSNAIHTINCSIEGEYLKMVYDLVFGNIPLLA